MNTEATKQTEDSPLNPAAVTLNYDLTDGERMVFQALRNSVGQAKLNVYELNSQLEIALKTVDAAEARFSGALTLAANSRGLGAVTLAEDFSRFLLPQGSR